MHSIHIPYGKAALEIAIPNQWLGVVANPQDVSAAADPQALLRASLRNPLGSPPLRELVKPGMRTALIVDDFTRKTPVDQILPLLLEELHRAGLSQDNICIVLALGTHRPMTEAEVRAKLGLEAMRGYKIVNVPASDRDQLVYLGGSERGIPGWVSRFVAEADLRIGVGMITPHLEAGFTGGAKIILPGVCGEATVDAFHQASAFIRENQLGNIRAPLRNDLEQFVAQVVPLHFIVNLILTLQGEIFQCVAGDVIEAHRAGVEYARQVYGVRLDRRYPVVLANAYPYDQDLWQSVKGIFCGDLLVEDGGTLIVLTAAQEGNSSYPLLPDYIGRDPEELLSELQAGGTRDPKQAATGVMMARLRRRIHLALVSSGLTPSDAHVMNIPFFETANESLQSAFERLSPDHRHNSLAVLPYAGVVLPLLESPRNHSLSSYHEREGGHAAK